MEQCGFAWLTILHAELPPIATSAGSAATRNKIPAGQKSLLFTPGKCFPKNLFTCLRTHFPFTEEVCCHGNNNDTFVFIGVLNVRFRQARQYYFVLWQIGILSLGSVQGEFCPKGFSSKKYMWTDFVSEILSEGNSGVAGWKISRQKVAKIFDRTDNLDLGIQSFNFVSKLLLKLGIFNFQFSLSIDEKKCRQNIFRQAKM